MGEVTTNLQRIDDLEEILSQAIATSEKMGKAIASIKSEASKDRKRVITAIVRLDAFDETTLEKTLAKGNEHASFLNQRMQVIILQNCVLSECVRILEKRSKPSAPFILNCVQWMDKGDEWWRSRSEWTINRWLKEAAS